MDERFYIMDTNWWQKIKLTMEGHDIRSAALNHKSTYKTLSPIWRGFAPGFVNYKKWCTRFAAASDKVYQLLAHGQWFSPGTPASFTTKTGRHDIAEILLKVALKHQKINQSILKLTTDDHIEEPI